MPTSLGHHNQRTKDLRLRKDERNKHSNKTLLERQNGKIEFDTFNKETVEREVQKIRKKAKAGNYRNIIWFIVSLIVACTILYILFKRFL